MTPNSLPTPAQLGLLLHDILVDIERWALALDQHPEFAEQLTGMTAAVVAELTDIAENIPFQFINPDEHWLAIIDGSVRRFAAKYPFARRYAVALDATPAELRRKVIGDRAAEPAAATA